MTRVNPFTRPPQGAGNPNPTPAPCDPVPEGLVERIIEAIQEEEGSVMAERIDPRELSQRELDDYLDQMVNEGKEESPEFRRAFKFWEKTQ